MYDSAAGVWREHKDLPESDDILFPTSPDSGCFAVIDEKIITFGASVTVLDWATWELVKIAESDGRGVGSKCSLIKNENEEYGFFFLSGDFFNLNTTSWSTFSVPFSSFNLVSLSHKPSLLSLAYQNGSCAAGGGCDGNTLFGDHSVMQHNMAQDTWTELGRKIHTIILAAGGFLCQLRHVSFLEIILRIT